MVFTLTVVALIVVASSFLEIVFPTITALSRETGKRNTDSEIQRKTNQSKGKLKKTKRNTGTLTRTRGRPLSVPWLYAFRSHVVGLARNLAASRSPSSPPQLLQLSRTLFRRSKFEMSKNSILEITPLQNDPKQQELRIRSIVWINRINHHKYRCVPKMARRWRRKNYH